MSLSKNLGNYAYVARRINCGCIVALSTFFQRAVRELYVEFEGSDEYEIDVMRREDAVNAMKFECPHQKLVCPKGL